MAINKNTSVQYNTFTHRLSFYIYSLLFLRQSNNTEPVLTLHVDVGNQLRVFAFCCLITGVNYGVLFTSCFFVYSGPTLYKQKDNSSR